MVIQHLAAGNYETMKKSSLALLITVIIWGTTYVVTKAVLDDIQPLTLTYLRFVIALIVLLPAALREGFRVADAFRGEMVLFGLTGVAVFFGFQNVALVYTSSSSAALILASVPAITTALAVLILRETLNPWQWLGIGLALLCLDLAEWYDDLSPAELGLAK